MGRPKRTGPRKATGGVLLVQHCLSGHTLVVSAMQIRKRMSDNNRHSRRESIGAIGSNVTTTQTHRATPSVSLKRSSTAPDDS